MNKIKNNKILVFLLIITMTLSTFASIISNQDGNNFVTKEEFDDLQDNFSNQIDNYEVSISEKIEGAIASYLNGVKLMETVILDPYVPVDPSNNKKNVIVSISKDDVKKNKQMKYSVSYQTTKMDFDSIPTTFPISANSNWQKQYTYGVAKVNETNTNRVFILSETDPYTVKGYYPEHTFIFTGSQTFALGTLAVHSIYAWNDFTGTLKMNSVLDAPSLYDAGSSLIDTLATQDDAYYFRDDDTWQLGSYIPYSSTTCRAVGTPVSNDAHMVYSTSVLSSRHDARDSGGNLYITQSYGTERTDFLLINDDDVKVNIWNEADSEMEQYNEDEKYSTTEHGYRYWFAIGEGQSEMHHSANEALKCISILRMPFLRPQQTKTSSAINNLKDVYYGKPSDLTGVKQGYCGGLPLARTVYAGDCKFKLKIEGTDSYTGKICIEIADEPFPRGLSYSEAFKKHLVKINKQGTWQPYELDSGTEKEIQFSCDKDTIYYLRFYHKNSTYGGKITYLPNIENIPD